MVLGNCKGTRKEKWKDIQRNIRSRNTGEMKKHQKGSKMKSAKKQKIVHDKY